MIDDVRLWAHALLIEPVAAQLGPNIRTRKMAEVRGFGVEGSEPIFTKWIDTQDDTFTLADAHDPTAIFVSDSEPEGCPLFQGCILTFGGVNIQVISMDSKRPLAIDRFVPDERNRHCAQVWATLAARVSQFWMAPNMPFISYRPVSANRYA